MLEKEVSEDLKKRILTTCCRSSEQEEADKKRERKERCIKYSWMKPLLLKLSFPVTTERKAKDRQRGHQEMARTRNRCHDHQDEEKEVEGRTSSHAMTVAVFVVTALLPLLIFATAESNERETVQSLDLREEGRDKSWQELNK